MSEKHLKYLCTKMTGCVLCMDKLQMLRKQHVKNHATNLICMC